MLTIPDYRLRLPGPTAVPERVRQATALPVLNHRGAEFKAMLAECQQRLKPIFGTAHDVLIFAGSGTAMMEAALANILSPGDAIMIVSVRASLGSPGLGVSSTPASRCAITVAGSSIP